MFLSISKISIITSKTQTHGRFVSPKTAAVAIALYQPLASRVLVKAVIIFAPERMHQKLPSADPAADRPFARLQLAAVMQS